MSNKETILAAALKEWKGNFWFWVSMSLMFLFITGAFLYNIWQYLVWFLIGILLLLMDAKIMIAITIFLLGALVALLMSKVILETIINKMK